MENLLKQYSQRYVALVGVSVSLEQLIKSYLSDIPSIDRITCRAKDPKSFVAKAMQKNRAGRLKYFDPITEIQDQIGARVIVKYLRDVGIVLDTMDEWFRPVEETVHEPESPYEFGYFGEHRIYPLPNQIVPEGIGRIELPRFFELQVRTLSQHAWSEAEHDLGYKSRTGLTREHRRLLALASAQAWGIDRIFEELREELLGDDDIRAWSPDRC